MTTSTTFAESSVEGELRQLKRNAQNVRDIAAWFMSHSELLTSGEQGTVVDVVVGIRAKSSKEFVQISNNVNSYELEMFRERDPENDLILSVDIYRHCGRRPPLMLKALSTQVNLVSHPDPVEKWELPASLSEWSFLVAGCAGRYIRNEMWNSGKVANMDFVDRVRDYLNVQLPKHFPGVSLDSLRALHDSGLISNMLSSEIQQLIFDSRRVSGVTIGELPRDLGLTDQNI